MTSIDCFQRVEAVKHNIQLKNIRGFLLLLIINLKFLFDVILSYDVFALNCVLYLFILFAIDYRRISWDFFLIPLFLAISVVNRNALVCVYILTLLYVLKHCSLKFFACSNIIILSSVIVITYFLIEFGVVKVSENIYVNLGRIRHRMDFGFGNSNQFAIFCFSLLGNIYVLVWKKYKFLFFLILTIIASSVANYTDSRTFILSAVVLFLSCFIQIFGWDKNRFYKTCVLLLPLIFLAYSTILPYNDTYGIFNAISSGRMNYYKELLDSITIKDILVGSPNIQEITIDSTYLKLLFEGGIVFSIIFYMLYIYVVKNRYEILYPYLPIVVAIIIYGAFESYFANSSNTGNLLIWMILCRCFLYPRF